MFNNWKRSPYYHSLLGIVRTLIVQTTLWPLNVIRVRQQGNFECALTASEVAKKVLQKEGKGAFFRGLPPQLVRHSIKQGLIWPVITQLPITLEGQGFSKYSSQALTGLAVAGTDAVLTSPIERFQVKAMLGQPNRMTVWQFMQKGWDGFSTYLTKSSVAWVAFLVSHTYFRSQEGNRDVSFLRTTWIAFKTTCVVTTTVAPFDTASTIRLGQGRSRKELFQGNVMRNLYAGSRMRFAVILLHNIATAIVLEIIRDNEPEGQVS